MNVFSVIGRMYERLQCDWEKHSVALHTIHLINYYRGI